MSNRKKFTAVTVIIVIAIVAIFATNLRNLNQDNQVKQRQLEQKTEQLKQTKSQFKELNEDYIKAKRNEKKIKALDKKNKELQKRLESALQAKKSSTTTLAQTPATQAPVHVAANSDSLSQWLSKLRECESGGNYSINTGNGFYGAYQFMDSTWDHWNTGYARADLALPSVQDATIIKNTKASSGGLATQNPGCFSKMGLSAFPPS